MQVTVGGKKEKIKMKREAGKGIEIGIFHFLFILLLCLEPKEKLFLAVQELDNSENLKGI